MFGVQEVEHVYGWVMGYKFYYMESLVHDGMTILCHRMSFDQCNSKLVQPILWHGMPDPSHQLKQQWGECNCIIWCYSSGQDAWVILIADRRIVVWNSPPKKTYFCMFLHTTHEVRSRLILPYDKQTDDLALFGAQISQLFFHVGTGGSQAIFDVGGQDGTVTFEAVHNKEMVSRSLCVMTFLDCMSTFFLPGLYIVYIQLQEINRNHIYIVGGWIHYCMQYIYIHIYTSILWLYNPMWATKGWPTRSCWCSGLPPPKECTVDPAFKVVHAPSSHRPPHHHDYTIHYPS